CFSMYIFMATFIGLIMNSKCQQTLYKKGIVIARCDSILHIESRKKTYKIEEAKVYPLGAPMPFVYNMFWICGCENRP
ncbi:hypothetical protein ABTG57_16360, partial [Acinetobacter baumannii]